MLEYEHLFYSGLKEVQPVPPKKHPTIWSASPHTIAKVAILEGYLQAWYPIFGRAKRRVDLLYVDGFAGPGKYTNHPDGSPIVALRAAAKALSASGSEWTAGVVHCAFIELNRRRYEHLDEHIEPFRGNPRLSIQVLRASFVDGIEVLKRQMPQAFSGSWPLFVFIDPFGATGAPFSTVADILSSPRSEVLILFDADAVARIYRAGVNADHERILNSVYGNESWKAVFSEGAAFGDWCRAALDLYKERLRSLKSVRYTFSFEMTKSGLTPDYFLVFASQHHRGLEKMKEAMKTISQNGEYRFSDAHVGRPMLFRFDRPDDFALRMSEHFAGKSATYADVRDYALNETPFVNPKSMLKLLESESLITVHSSNQKRKRGHFPEETTERIEFRSEADDG